MRHRHAAALPSLADAAWLRAPECQAVMSAIEAGGHGARAVGGAVRNALLGVPVKDVDIATTATPDEVIALATAAGLKALPTGKEHGTITVVSAHVPFEVTTLRRDVETFGRHATVTFTRDWAEDARRRDFTMNALYCAADGTVLDPLGGYGDLEARRVRFIGDAHARIEEDFLRILRFFRLHAEYGRGDPDAEGLKACIAHRGGLTFLSGERIRAELLRLLAAPRAAEVTATMAEGGILRLVLALTEDLRLLARMAAIDAAQGFPPDPVLRLAALAVSGADDVPHLQQRLRLSAAEAATLKLAVDLAPRPFDPDIDEHEARIELYHRGPERYRALGRLAWAHALDEPTDPRRRARLDLPLRWQAPALPVRGADLLTLGIPKGPRIGEILAAFEAWWLAEGFPSDAAMLRTKLTELASPQSAP